MTRSNGYEHRQLTIKWETTNGFDSAANGTHVHNYSDGIACTRLDDLRRIIILVSFSFFLQLHCCLNLCQNIKMTDSNNRGFDLFPHKKHKFHEYGIRFRCIFKRLMEKKKTNICRKQMTFWNSNSVATSRTINSHFILLLFGYLTTANRNFRLLSIVPKEHRCSKSRFYDYHDYCRFYLGVFDNEFH